MGTQRIAIAVVIGFFASGCGKVESSETDAPPAAIDAPTAIDAPAIDAPANDPVQLQVNVTGPGTVSVAPNAVSCGPGCTRHQRGTNVTITPQPDSGAGVMSWSGACASTAGNAPCLLTLTADTTTIDIAFRPAFTVSTFDVTGAVQSYEVPAGATRLQIVADGASGGDAITTTGGAYTGGYGARVDTVVDVAGGQVLTIIVGQRPDPHPPGSDGCGASGGGASMVAMGTTVLAVAGGGGGASAYSSYSINGGDAQLGSDGASSSNVAGGTGGNGGGGSGAEGGGGAGVSTDGGSGEGMGGQALLNGAAGGRRAETESCGAVGGGGFGGGGGGGNDVGGGGGGYSGGAAQTGSATGVPAGGGGSFGMGTPTITVRADVGHGRIVLTPQ